MYSAKPLTKKSPIFQKRVTRSSRFRARFPPDQPRRLSLKSFVSNPSFLASPTRFTIFHASPSPFHCAGTSVTESYQRNQNLVKLRHFLNSYDEKGKVEDRKSRERDTERRARILRCATKRFIDRLLDDGML
jgi:hypothetical protein